MNTAIITCLLVLLPLFTACPDNISTKNNRHRILKAVVVLAKHPYESVGLFLSKFCHYDTYLLYDRDNFKVTSPVFYPHVKYIAITSDESRKFGFKMASIWQITKNTKRDNVGAWDKALLYFTNTSALVPLLSTYTHVWIMEDDVFLYSEHNLMQIDKNHRGADLVSAFNPGSNECTKRPNPEKGCTYRATPASGWLWPRLLPTIPKAITCTECAMVPVVRLSAAFLQQIATFAKTHNTLFFIEALFPSLALTHGHTISQFKFDTHRFVRDRMRLSDALVITPADFLLPRITERMLRLTRS